MGRGRALGGNEEPDPALSRGEPDGAGAEAMLCVGRGCRAVSRTAAVGRRCAADGAAGVRGAAGGIARGCSIGRAAWKGLTHGKRVGRRGNCAILGMISLGGRSRIIIVYSRFRGTPTLIPLTQ